jgi:hypothetical protein
MEKIMNDDLAMRIAVALERIAAVLRDLDEGVSKVAQALDVIADMAVAMAPEENR